MIRPCDEIGVAQLSRIDEADGFAQESTGLLDVDVLQAKLAHSLADPRQEQPLIDGPEDTGAGRTT